MQDIYILHENPEWVVPLYEAFDKRGVAAKDWFINEGYIPFDAEPPEGIFYNRMSASSHTRGHRYAPEFTRMVLTWLEKHNRTVVNDTSALYLEVCKISQYAALQQANVPTPKTSAVVGKQHLVSAVEAFNQFPFIIKPNRGGKGLGVQLFNSVEELTFWLESDGYEEPLDGTWLVQQYIKSDQPYITRCEFVGGKFLYAVRVNTEQGFQLCPADVCSIEGEFCPADASQPPNKFTITDELDGHPVIASLEQFLADNDIDVAGIEVIKNEQGDWQAYDVNTNTNYNRQAEETAGVPVFGMQAIADYLIELAN